MKRLLQKLLNSSKLVCFTIALLCFGSCHQSQKPGDEFDFEAYQNEGNYLLILANNAACWYCEKYYWELYHLHRQYPNLRMLWLTRKLKPSEAQDFLEEIDFKWSENVVHYQNSKLFRQKMLERKNPKAKVLLYCDGQIQEFIGDTPDLAQLIRSVKGCLKRDKVN